MFVARVRELAEQDRAGPAGGQVADLVDDFDFAAVGGTLLFYVGLTLLVDLLSALVRRDLR